MSTISLPQLEGSKVITSSRMGSFLSCPRRHHIEYNLGVRPEKTPGYFRFGAAYHIGLDSRSQGKGIDESIADAVAGYETLPPWVRTEEERHEWLVEREIVIRLLSGYFWYWERDDIRPDIRVDRVLESECSFELPIKNPETGGTARNFRLGGKRDQIVILGDGRKAVKENKTTGDDISPTSDYWLTLKFDRQISTYLHAAHAEGHTDVLTVLYDATRKPGIGPRQIPTLDENGLKIVIDHATGERMLKNNIKKDGTPGAGHGEPYQAANAEKGWVLITRIETPEEFGERLTTDISERPEFYYQRREIPRIENDLIDFEHELWDISQQLGESIRNGRHYRNSKACLSMGRCPYIDTICPQNIDLTTEVPQGFRRVVTVHEEL